MSPSDFIFSHWHQGAVLGVKHMTYQQTLKLLGLSDVNPAVFFNDFDVFYFIIESVKPNTTEKSIVID